jgi:hypothetical protein
LSQKYVIFLDRRSSLPCHVIYSQYQGENRYIRNIVQANRSLISVCIEEQTTDDYSVGSDKLDKRTIDNRANLSIIDHRSSITIIIELGPWQYYRATT